MQHHQKFIRQFALAASIAAVFPALASAVDRTWTNQSANSLWGTSTNWSGSTLPGSSDNALFTDTAGGGSVDLGATTRTINTLHFANSLTFYDLTDGTLALAQIIQDSTAAENEIDAAISTTSLSIAASGGLLDIEGSITATNLTISSTTSGGQVEFDSSANSFSTIAVNSGGMLDAFNVGSTGAAPVQLNGGTLNLYSDTPNANYGNNLTVNSTSQLMANAMSAAGPLSNTFRMGTLTMNAGGQLTFGSQNSYAIAFNSTSINGAAIFVGTQQYLGTGVAQLQLGAVSQTVANSSITLDGIGELLLNHASTYTGGTNINGGMVILGVNGAAGSGAVNVYSGGAVSIASGVTSFPSLNIGAGGVADAALVGDLTAAIYSGANQNVFLSPGSIIAASAGQLPVRGTDVSSAAYYLGITSDTQTATVGDNGSTSIFMGAAFGIYTPTTSAFSGTLSAAQTGQSIPVYIAPGSQTFSSASFNTTAGVNISGPGEMVLTMPLAGTATNYTISGDSANSQASILLSLASSNDISSSQTFSVSNGIVYPGSATAVANGGILNINSNATLYLDPSAMTNGPTTGTFNINAGGALYVSSNFVAPGQGATFTFSPSSTVLLGGNFSTSAGGFLPNQSDIILDTTGTISITGSGLVLGNGHRLTTPNNASVTLTGGTGITGSTTASISASGSSSALEIDDLVNLPNTTLTIGDTNSFTTTSSADFVSRVSAPQTGTVILNNASDTIKNLQVNGGTLIVDQNFSTGQYSQSNSVATFHSQFTATGAFSLSNSSVAHLGSAYSSTNPNSIASLSLATGTTLDIGGNTLDISSISASALRSDILAAYDNGNWDQAGLTSSLIASHPGTAIGYTISGSSAVARLTWLGDTNLDGVINTTDLSNISPTGTTWAQGDFNYDGKVNADDYSLFMLGAAYGKSSIASVLPEPSIAFAGSVLLVCVSGKRRKMAT
ncbi:MAG TPA: hypothetical protein VGG19_20090 [Tepidisphaeraceae bacterium]